MATHLPVVTATGPRGPFLLDLSMFSPQEMAGVFQLPWCTTVHVWDEVWAIFPPLSNGALSWERLLSQGCLGMKTAQPSGVHPFHGELRMALRSSVLPCPIHPVPQRVLLTVMEDSLGCPEHAARRGGRVVSHAVRTSQGDDVAWNSGVQRWHDVTQRGEGKVMREGQAG